VISDGLDGCDRGDVVASASQALQEGDAIGERAACHAGVGRELVEAVECAGAHREVYGHTVFHEPLGVGEGLCTEKVQLADLEVGRWQIVECVGAGDRGGSWYAVGAVRVAEVGPPAGDATDQTRNGSTAGSAVAVRSLSIG